MVHLNITLREDLYQQLKAKVAPKKLSAFIAESVKMRMGPSRNELDEAYMAASHESWRKRLADEWAVTETEAWPE